MGEKQNQPFQLSFNAALKIEFQGSRVTSDGGLILVRELDERLGLGELIEQHLRDPRRGKNTQFPLADLLRQSVYSRLAGYEDVNDAERLSQDPTFRLIGSEKISRARRGADFPVAILRDRDAGTGLRSRALEPPHACVVGAAEIFAFRVLEPAVQLGLDAAAQLHPENGSFVLGPHLQIQLLACNR
jgi:hypothetical protein